MWFYYGLAAAFLSAIIIILTKKILYRVDAITVAFTQSFFALPLLGVILIYNRNFSVGFWFLPAIFAAAAFSSWRRITRFEIFQRNNLSSIIPLASLIPLFTYVLGIIFLNEIISPAAVFGIVLSIFGAYVLNFRRGQNNLLKPVELLLSNRDSRLFLLLMFMVSVGSILEKFSVNQTVPASPAFTALVEDIFFSFFVFAYAARKKVNLIHVTRHNFPLLFLSGVLWGLLGLFVFYGIAEAPVALVSAVKKLEILFTLLLSWIFFHDRPNKWVWAGTILMIIGAILIKI